MYVSCKWDNGIMVRDDRLEIFGMFFFASKVLKYHKIHLVKRISIIFLKNVFISVIKELCPFFQYCRIT